MGTCGLSLDERKLIAFCVVGPASLLPKGIVTSPLIMLILLIQENGVSIYSSYYSCSSVALQFSSYNLCTFFKFISMYLLLSLWKGYSSFCFLGGYCWYIRKALGLLDTDIIIRLILTALMDFLWFSRYKTNHLHWQVFLGFTFLLTLPRKPF